MAGETKKWSKEELDYIRNLPSVTFVPTKTATHPRLMIPDVETTISGKHLALILAGEPDFIREGSVKQGGQMFASNPQAQAVVDNEDTTLDPVDPTIVPGAKTFGQ